MRTLVLIALLASASAAAQLRTIPADAKPAQMSHVGENVVAVDGKPAQLAAGAQIRDEANRIIQPTALPAGARVKYALDANGHVHRVWILTPQEAAEKP
ncbi:MAG TPA: hypothetical protein VFK84_08725 [Burkholderiales bacterium]|nr:hypothetical protein [Burkholderiales bacterium]